MDTIINVLIYSGTIIIEIIFCFICCYFTSLIMIGISIFLITNILVVLLTRILIQYYTFIGQTFVHTSIILFTKGKGIASNLSSELKKIISELKVLIGIDKSIYNQYWNNFDDLLLNFDNASRIINMIKKSYDLIREKGKRLTRKQIEFETQMNIFIRLLNKSQLKLFIGIKVSLNKEDDCEIGNGYSHSDSNHNHNENKSDDNVNNMYLFIKRKINNGIVNNNNLLELCQFFNFHFSKAISQVIVSSEILLKSLSIYDNKTKWNQMLFQDYLSSFELLKSFFDNRFKERYTQHTLSRYLSSIEYVIIKGEKTKGDIRTLMIVSGMNMVYYEDLSEFNQYNMYLEHGIDVLFWNYRGYGCSKGVSTINSIKTDIIDIFDEVNQIGRWDHYGSHGMSIGSIPSTYLAAHRPLDLLVIDRGFSSINKFIANWNTKPLELFYNIFLMPSSDNVTKYLQSKCRKIIMSSINDIMITDACNIKTGISIKIIKSSIRLRRPPNKDQASSSLHISMTSSTELNEHLINKDQSQNAFSNSIDHREYYSQNETITDLLDVLISKESQLIIINVLVLLFDIIDKVIKDERNSMKSSKIDFIIRQDILIQILSTESYQLIDNFTQSFNYCNSSLKTLDLNKSFQFNKEIVGVFFSNLFIWQLNKDSLNGEFENTLGSSLDTLTLLMNHLDSINAPIRNQVRQLYEVCKDIKDKWAFISVIPSKGFPEPIDLNQIGKVIKLKCDHGAELSQDELAHLKSLLHELSFGLFEEEKK